MDSALIAKDFVCKYEDQIILQNLSLDVKKGEIVCLLGASGCGKTTMLKAIAGLLPLASGSMQIHDRSIVSDTQTIPPECRNIGMIFQDYALFPHLTVGNNIAFGLRDLSKKEKQERVSEMLNLVKLSGLENRFPHQLSGGQQQRVAIARALANKPDLLLLDEPFSNIDAQVRFALIKEIRQLFKKQGVTAIFVTHSREEAFAFADKLAVMNQGVIEQYGSPIDLYHQPKSRFVANFLGIGSYINAVVTNGTLQTSLGHPSYSYLQELAGHPLSASHLQDGEFDWLIRPHAILLKLDNNGSGEIIDRQFMGEGYRYLVQINEQILAAHSHESIDLNQRVGIEITPHQPALFSKEKMNLAC